eukprot:881313_1
MEMKEASPKERHNHKRSSAKEQPKEEGLPQWVYRLNASKEPRNHAFTVSSGAQCVYRLNAKRTMKSQKTANQTTRFNKDKGAIQRTRKGKEPAKAKEPKVDAKDKSI